jgi:hypothetical protein
MTERVQEWQINWHRDDHEEEVFFVVERAGSVPTGD